jgi:hypothetical protein
MATEAQIEANRRNAMKSTGPTTQDGKNKSRFNALDHGCRARVLVLPDEDPAQQEKCSQSWFSHWRPRNPSEEFLVDRLAGLTWQAKRIQRADSGRLNTRVHRGDVVAIDGEQQDVIELGQRLFRDADGSRAPRPPHDLKMPVGGDWPPSIFSNGIDDDHPRSLVHRLKELGAGCQWLLEQWAGLRTLLERGLPWLAPDQLRAVRLLGRRPTDALFNEEIAQVYLAGHMLLDQDGDPFQQVLDELAPQEAAQLAKYLRLRHYRELAPQDGDAARRVLLEIVDRASADLTNKADVLREVAERDAPWAAESLLWDDSDEGERMRRYELSCDRTWLRMYELLLKVRKTGVELDDATMARLRRSAPAGNAGAIDRPAPLATTVITPPAGPVEPPALTNEANSRRENAPNEANSSVQTPTADGGNLPRASKSERRRARHRADQGRRGQASFHQELERQVAGRSSPLLDVSAII